MFYTFQGAKDIFLPKVTQIWSSTGKKIKNSLSSFFKIGGGGGGGKPKMTNVIFFYFFLMKASLSSNIHSGFFIYLAGNGERP